MKTVRGTFNNFCKESCDGLYEPNLPYEAQSIGYKQLRKMIEEGIAPASLKDIERWEKEPTIKEVMSDPDIRYLRFLHPILRIFIINNWSYIKDLEL